MVRTPRCGSVRVRNGVSANFQIIPRHVGRLGRVRVRVRARTPCRGSVMVRTPSRGGGISGVGVFSVGGCLRGELSPGGYLLESTMTLEH